MRIHHSKIVWCQRTSIELNLVLASRSVKWLKQTQSCEKKSFPPKTEIEKSHQKPSIAIIQS